MALAGHDVQLDVMDRGPGIAEADRARLLQPFQRSESSRSRATGGPGWAWPWPPTWPGDMPANCSCCTVRAVG